MSYTVQLHGGPLDGEQLALPEPPADTETALELEPGAAYRIRVWDTDAQDADTEDLGFGVGYYVPDPGRVPWVFDRKTGSWERGDVVPNGSPLTLGEAALVALVFAAIGFGLALSLALVAGLGWAVDRLAAIAGGWGPLTLWVAGGLAALGVTAAIANPSTFREDPK
jgi:hypothetical protein